MTKAVDVVVIGGGHNGLVAAAYLARAELPVDVLERSQVAGGAVRSEELTEPGFIHDTLSATHIVFKLSETYDELSDEVAFRGLRYCDTPNEAAATVLPDSRALVAYRDVEQTVAGFDERGRGSYLDEIEGFGSSAAVFGDLLSTELFSVSGLQVALRVGRKLGWRGDLAFTADALLSARAWFEARFVTDGSADLYSPWARHSGLSPDSAGSGFQALAIAGSIHQACLPVVEGGSQNFVRAFEIWIQRQQVPYGTRGDAASTIDVADGTWRANLVVAVTERVLSALESHVETGPAPTLPPSPRHPLSSSVATSTSFDVISIREAVTSPSPICGALSPATAVTPPYRPPLRVRRVDLPRRWSQRSAGADSGTPDPQSQPSASRSGPSFNAAAPDFTASIRRTRYGQRNP